jgi:hypothetical protein
MIATSYAKLMCSVLLAAAPIFAVISIAVAQQPPPPKGRTYDLEGGTRMPVGVVGAVPGLKLTPIDIPTGSLRAFGTRWTRWAAYSRGPRMH